MNPLDLYLLSKHADAPQAGGWGPTLRNAAIQTGVGLAVAGAPLAASHVYNAVTKRHHFNKMMEHNEDLQAYHAQDPARFNQLFTSLHGMNPEFAADPIVAGSYMRQMAAHPAGAGKALVEARGAAKALPTHPLSDVMKGMAPTMGKAIAEGTAPKARAAQVPPDVAKG